MTVAIAQPVEIQVISWIVAPTAPRMCGRATLTMEASIAPISVPNVTETVTSHLLAPGRGEEGSIRTVTQRPRRGAATRRGDTRPEPPGSRAACLETVVDPLPGVAGRRPWTHPIS